MNFEQAKRQLLETGLFEAHQMNSRVLWFKRNHDSEWKVLFSGNGNNYHRTFWWQSYHQLYSFKEFFEFCSEETQQELIYYLDLF